MDNNINFRGSFTISQNVKNKFAFRNNFPIKIERSLQNKFEKITQNSIYNLELASINPITGYSFFQLKDGDSILASSHESFWEKPLERNVSKLVAIYNKLIIKKNYDQEINKINDEHMKQKKYLTVIKDKDGLINLEQKFQKQIEELNKKYNDLFSIHLVG